MIIGFSVVWCEVNSMVFCLSFILLEGWRIFLVGELYDMVFAMVLAVGYLGNDCPFVARFLMGCLGWRRKLCKELSLIHGICGLVVLVEDLAIVLLAIEISVTRANNRILCIMPDIFVDQRTTLFLEWRPVYFSYIPVGQFIVCAWFVKCKEIGRWSVPCKSSRRFKVQFNDNVGVESAISIAEVEPVARLTQVCCLLLNNIKW